MSAALVCELARGATISTTSDHDAAATQRANAGVFSFSAPP
jgi:hypothetical protein